jgi:hypothetical protein
MCVGICVVTCSHDFACVCVCSSCTCWVGRARARASSKSPLGVVNSNNGVVVSVQVLSCLAWLEVLHAELVRCDAPPVNLGMRPSPSTAVGIHTCN